jgi:hypothetical protein
MKTLNMTQIPEVVACVPENFRTLGGNEFCFSDVNRAELYGYNSKAKGWSQ